MKNNITNNSINITNIKDDCKNLENKNIINIFEFKYYFFQGLKNK